MKYKKWRELSLDPFKIPFTNFKLIKILNYLPAGNDVIECLCDFNGQNKKVFIKIERSKMADFTSELQTITTLTKEGYYSKTPQIIESGIYENKKYIVLSKITGLRLSKILSKAENTSKKKEYLEKYGHELALLHTIPKDHFKDAKQRIINYIPKLEHYQSFDDFINFYIEYLKKEEPSLEFNSFIHGDFHYANILWRKEQISGVLDYEYSGYGLKEQDIAWALVLRPGQKFMNNIEDIKSFLTGYNQLGTYDNKKLKWCLINAYCHFYLMNKDNKEYLKTLKSLLTTIYQIEIL